MRFLLLMSVVALGVSIGHWDALPGDPPALVSWENEIPVALCLAMVIASPADVEAMAANSPYWRPYIDCYIFGIDDRAPTEVPAAILKAHAVVAPRFLHLFYLQHRDLEGPGHIKTVLLRETAMTYSEATHVALVEPGWRAVPETFNRLQLYVITEGPAPPRGWPQLQPGESPPNDEACKIFPIRLSAGEGGNASWRWADCIVSLSCAGIIERRDVSPLGAAVPESWVIGAAAAEAHRRATGVDDTAAAFETLVGFRMLPWEVHVRTPTEPLALRAAAGVGVLPRVRSTVYRKLAAVGDADIEAMAKTELLEIHDQVVKSRAAAEAMARGDTPFDCWPYHVFSYLFRGPKSHFAELAREEWAPVLPILGASLASSDPDWRVIARYNLAAALTHLNRTTEAFALYSEIFNIRGPTWAEPQPMRPASLAPLYIVTVASDAGDGLRNLIASIKVANVPCLVRVLGLGVRYKYHGIKIPLYGDFLASLNPEQLVLGLDAYDTLVLPALAEVAQKFAAMAAPIVVCGERGTWPDVGVVPFYPHHHYHRQPPGAGRFPLLNSGVFTGRADALAKLFGAVREQGPVAVCGDDQRAFIREYFAEPNKMRIDVEAEMFLAIHGAGNIRFWLDGAGVYHFRAGDDGPDQGVAPAVVHFNAMDGKNAYPKVVEWWKKSVIAKGNGHLLEVSDEELRRAAGAE